MARRGYPFPSVAADPFAFPFAILRPSQIPDRGASCSKPSCPRPVRGKIAPVVHTLFRAYGYLRPYRRYVVGSIITLILIDAAMLLTPQIIRYGVDTGIGQSDLRALYVSAALLLLVTLGRGVLAYFQMRWIELQSQGVAYDLRNAIHARLAALSFSYHDRAQTGQLLSRASQDVERIRFLTGRATLRLVEGAVLLVTTSIVLLMMNPQLGFLTLLTLPLLLYRAVAFGKTIRPLSLSIQNQLGVLTTLLEQNLRGARVVKAFAQEDAEIDRFDAANNLWRELSIRSARHRSRPGAATDPDLQHQHGDRDLVRRVTRHPQPAHAGRTGGLHHLSGAVGEPRAHVRHDRAGGGHGNFIRRARLRDPRRALRGGGVAGRHPTARGRRPRPFRECLVLLLRPP